MTEKPELEKDPYGDIIEPPLENDYGSNVDALVDSMPVAPPTTHDVNTVHNELLNDPHYAVHLHERQLERLTTFVEELAKRLIALEEHIHGKDPNPGLEEYPEVKQ